MHDYIVGFKYGIGKLGNLPEFFFAKKTFTVPEGTVTVDADYKTSDCSFALSTKLTNKKNGFGLGFDANTKDRLTGLQGHKTFNFNGKKVQISSAYDIVKKKFTALSSFHEGDSRLAIKFDGKHPLLSFTRYLEKHSELTPTINMKTGEVQFEYSRKWVGGSLRSIIHPHSKVLLHWKDEGVGGAWSTTASLPLNDHSKPKVSVSREWSY